jgi:hypothetical protein
MGKLFPNFGLAFAHRRTVSSKGTPERPNRNRNEALVSLRARLLSAAALTLLAASTLPAHADSFSTFNLNGTLSDGGSFSGTVLLDTTTGLFTGADFTVLSIGGPYNFDSAPVGQNVISTFTFVTFRQTGGLDLFGLNLPEASLIGYTGGTLCSLDQPCLGASGLIYVSSPYGQDGSGPVAIAGTLTLASPTAVTPEPSSFVLLCTGVLGLAGATRRRFLIA